MKAKNLKLLPNQVLVKIEDDYETYQVNGRDTGIMSAITMDTTGQRVSVFGTIINVCEKLRYLGDELKKAKAENNEGDYLTSVRDRVREKSCKFNVPIEVKPGDRVMYLYKNQFDAYKSGKVVRTDDEGTCMFMDYSNLRAIVISEDSLYPLNGYLFVKSKELKKESVSEGGILLLEKKHMGMKFKRASAFAEVLEVGCFVDGYLEFLDSPADDRHKISKDDILIYDGRMATNLEFVTHQTLKTARMLLHRKDIHAHVLDKSLFEFQD